MDAFLIFIRMRDTRAARDAQHSRCEASLLPPSVYSHLLRRGTSIIPASISIFPARRRTKL